MKLSITIYKFIILWYLSCRKVWTRKEHWIFVLPFNCNFHLREITLNMVTKASLFFNYSFVLFFKKRLEKQRVIRSRKSKDRQHYGICVYEDASYIA